MPHSDASCSHSSELLGGYSSVRIFDLDFLQVAVPATCEERPSVGRLILEAFRSNELLVDACGSGCFARLQAQLYCLHPLNQILH